ncbi:uncharacterized protein BDR25DRAFT_395149 [Lindgomyces ingoldianus]|uniref:Uncharacterized protein n=1 Tax=Lindgomyces ingoldianus TaxID=673940 RepID=A0ACB6QMW4_9PLEO|nr:uncharacterized protein BDR25DRAFT_395149 [Lindgomyces ingoldianus]KAF2467637.1 hypothetical protein BDR25DRAFT_395149 [Lindgomyces ingoldianus]
MLEIVKKRKIVIAVEKRLKQNGREDEAGLHFESQLLNIIALHTFHNYAEHIRSHLHRRADRPYSSKSRFYQLFNRKILALGADQIPTARFVNCYDIELSFANLLTIKRNATYLVIVSLPRSIDVHKLNLPFPFLSFGLISFYEQGVEMVQLQRRAKKRQNKPLMNPNRFPFSSSGLPLFAYLSRFHLSRYGLGSWVEASLMLFQTPDRVEEQCAHNGSTILPRIFGQPVQIKLWSHPQTCSKDSFHHSSNMKPLPKASDLNAQCQMMSTAHTLTFQIEEILNVYFLIWICLEIRLAPSLRFPASPCTNYRQRAYSDYVIASHFARRLCFARN